MASDRRPFIYAAVDLVFAVAYVWIPLTFARTHDNSFELGSAVLALAALAMAVGTLARHAVGWWVAVCGCGVLLAGATLLLTLLAMSAAFLNGVYGAFGKGAAGVALVCMALVVELYVLLPAFQLKYLLSADGRRAMRAGGDGRAAVKRA